MKQYLPRWIKASVYKHFDDRKQGVPLFLEGDKRSTNEKQAYAELRMDGPFFKKLTAIEWNVYIEVNVLVQTIRKREKLYTNSTNSGIIAEAFTDHIDIYRYGGELVDDESFVGCLNLNMDGKRPLTIRDVGESRPTEPLNQTQVEGHYSNEFEF